MTAYRADLIHTIYENEIVKLASSSSMRMERLVVSCPTTSCGVQYSLLEPRNVTAEQIAKHTFAVEKALRQQYCPHHPPKIELE